MGGGAGGWGGGGGGAQSRFFATKKPKNIQYPKRRRLQHRPQVSTIRGGGGVLGVGFGGGCQVQQLHKSNPRPTLLLGSWQAPNVGKPFSSGHEAAMLQPSQKEP